MGRRNRRSDHGDGDDDDALEREWMQKRQKTTHDAAVADQHEQKEHNEQRQQQQKEGEAPSTDQIDRLRAKKQAQKQRRKDKKAQRKEEEAARTEHQQTLKQQKAKAEQEKKAKQQKQKQKQKPSSQQFHTLRKGVQYRDLVVGQGPAVRDRKKCRVRYVLRTKSHISGKILDSSQSFAFRLGKGEVIAGWDIGMDGMRVGGVRRLIVPPEAGYGNKDIGGGRGAILYFEIELLHVAP